MCMKMYNFLVTCHLILVLNVFTINAQISDKRLCANKDCTVPISRATTLMRYDSPDGRILSFRPNEEAVIFSKSAGSRLELWGAEIGKRRGYIPKTHVREYKIFTDKVTFLVDTENNNAAASQVPSANEQIRDKPSPDPVKLPYEVVDGTTIYEDVAVMPSVSESPQHITENLNQQTEPLKPAEASLKLVEEKPIKDDTLEFKQGDKGPVDDPESKKSDSPSKLNGVEDNNNNKELKTDESLVNNVLSSITQWIKEGSGSEGEDEDEEEEEPEEGEEEEQDDEDVEVENETEDHEDEVKLSTKEEDLDHLKEQNAEELKQTDNELNNNIREELKEVKKSQQQVNPTERADLVNENISFEDQNEFKDNMVTIDEKQPPSVETLNIDKSENKEPATNSLFDDNPQNPDNLKLNSNEKLYQSGPSESPFTPDLLVGEAGIHSQHTTQEPNYEFPGPTDPVTNEVTSNPLENTPDIVQVTASSHPEAIISELSQQQLEADTDLNINNNAQNEEKQLEDKDKNQNNLELEVSKINEQNDHLENLNEQSDALEDVNVASFDTTQSVERVEQEVLKEAIKQSEEIEQSSKEDDQLTKSKAKLEKTQEPVGEVDEATTEHVFSENVAVTEENQLVEEKLDQSLTDNHPHQENAFESPPDSPGIFSGIYSSVFGNSDVENVSDEASVKPDISEEEIQKNVKIDDDIEMPQKVENNVETVPLESNEPSARDILWGSSIRKEIEEKNEKHQHDFNTLLSKQPQDELSCMADPSIPDCPPKEEHLETQHSTINEDDFTSMMMAFPLVTYEVLIVLGITAVTVVVFLWGYMFIDKSRKEGPLIAKINELEKQVLVMTKENDILTEKLAQVEGDSYEQADIVSNEFVRELQNQLVEAQNIRSSLEEQIQTLEKELENSTEVGLELNRMLSDFLSSENGSETLVANIEQLQRQLIEQQGLINTYNENLSIKETENHELKLELDISNTKVTDLQTELNKMAINLLKAEEDKEQSQGSYEAEIVSLKEQIETKSESSKIEIDKLSEQLKALKDKFNIIQRELELKSNEYVLLKENINEMKTLKNNDETLKSLLDITSIKAELLQLRKEKQLLTEHLQQESDTKCALEKQAQVFRQDIQNLKVKYDEADCEKVEAETKLQVLSNYFKERETQLQKELSKQESMWVEKQGEAISTIERIKYMQEELQNYKAQNESLKQEIVAQEVQMKSQISMLEKKSHENWVAARQAERKLEDVKQEAAQLRNRITMRERNLNDEKFQNRLQSPLEQNGELPVSPMHISNDTAASPPLLYGTRDHLTTSPPLPGLPPFLPPPPGVPFMPPRLGGVPLPPPGFMPPPPTVMPGDHRPPPLGRMSSPPLNSRYSPDSRAYSPYSRNSPSPTSDDDYDRMPLPAIYRGYSPYSRGDERREFNRPPPPIRSNARNHKGGTHSSGSANSNESLEKINRHNSKV